MTRKDELSLGLSLRYRKEWASGLENGMKQWDELWSPTWVQSLDLPLATSFESVDSLLDLILNSLSKFMLCFYQVPDLLVLLVL